jgi:Subtilase family.
VISAIEFVTANKDRLGVDVINLSLGHPIYEPAATDPLVQAVEAAVRAGIVVVAAGGNYGVSSLTGLPGMQAFCRQAMRPRQLPSDRSRRSRRTHAPTIASQRIAPEDRRGTTALPSPIWSRPAMVSSRRPRN